jgi:hypothetical protein
MPARHLSASFLLKWQRANFFLVTLANETPETQRERERKRERERERERERARKSFQMGGRKQWQVPDQPCKAGKGRETEKTVFLVNEPVCKTWLGAGNKERETERKRERALH